MTREKVLCLLQQRDTIADCKPNMCSELHPAVWLMTARSHGTHLGRDSWNVIMIFLLVKQAHPSASLKIWHKQVRSLNPSVVSPLGWAAYYRLGEVKESCKQGHSFGRYLAKVPMPQDMDLLAAGLSSNLHLQEIFMRIFTFKDSQFPLWLPKYLTFHFSLHETLVLISNTCRSRCSS